MQKKLLPVWNLPPEQPLTPGSRDPLGFQRYATRFADSLLPNLTVLTTRARYYAFLAWALDEITTAFEPNLLLGESLPYDEYSEFLSRFERYLALAEAVRHNMEASLSCNWVGQRRSRALTRGNRSNLSLDISLTVQEGSNGVLADYRQSFLRLGWLTDTPINLPDELSEEGQKLADCFRRSIKFRKAERIRDTCLNLQVNSVKVEDLDNQGHLLCLSSMSEDERQLLRPKLLGGAHSQVVAELRSLFRRRRLTESDIFKQYLPSTEKTGTAFDLKQIALYEVFALACLGMFGGIHKSLGSDSNIQSLEELLANQLQLEGITASASLNSVTKNVEWENEVDKLITRDETQQSQWLKPTLRLLTWVSRFVRVHPNVVVVEPVDSVSLTDAVELFGQSSRRIDEIALVMSERLLRDHQRVFLSKRKRPWLNLSGRQIQLAENIEQPRLTFPPNSVRLNSLISIYRDLM